MGWESLIIPLLAGIFSLLPPDFPNESFLDRVAEVESSNDPRAVSPVGARGLFQFMEPTWGDHSDLPFDKAFDPVESRKVARKYFKWIAKTLKSYGRCPNEKDILACYNWGIGNYRKSGYDLNKVPNETAQYIEKVLNE